MFFNLKLDYFIILFIVPIVGISCFLVSEIQPDLAYKQYFYYFVSLIIFIIFMTFSLRKFIWVIPIIYWLNVILLISVNFFGVVKLGAKRWLEIPFFGDIVITIQPSEFAKPTLILMLAYLISNNPPRNTNGYGISKFLYFSFYILLPFFLIAIEPDLGTGLVLIIIGYGILFLCKVNYKIWVFLGFFTLFFVPFSYKYILHDYQKSRIDSFLAPKPSYQVRQSLIAIGSGGLNGKSKENATQTQLKFLPIASSDFLFAYLIERFGFSGGFFLLFLYLILVLHIFHKALVYKKDFFLKVVSIGVSFLIFFYVVINISMTIGLAPVVGLPLPFFSYGGSSFVTFTILIAILQNLLAFRFKFMYNS
jgi:rod shape determining protein RodA